MTAWLSCGLVGARGESAPSEGEGDGKGDGRGPRTAIALVLMLLFGAACLACWWQSDSAPPAVPAPREHPPAPMFGLPEASAPAVPVSLGPRAAVSSPAEADTVPASARAPLILSGRCVDAASGTPLSGCEVALSATLRAGAEVTEHLAATWQDPPAAVTAADGTFRIACAPPPSHAFHLRVRSPGRLDREGRWTSLSPGALDLGDLAIATGCAVRGVVHDTDGVAQPCVEVVLHGNDGEAREGILPPRAEVAVTRADGTFDARVPPGRWPLTVVGRIVHAPEEIEIDTDQRTAFVAIAVEPRASVACVGGTVTDAAGRALEGVRVVARSAGALVVTRTASDGSFRIERWSRASDDAVELACSSPSGTHEALVESHRWGDTDLRLVMRPRLGVELVVVDARTGAPIEDFGVRCFVQRDALRPVFFDNGGELRALGRHPDGRALLDCVARGRNVLLVAPCDPAWDRTQAVAFDATEGSAPLRVALARSVAARVRVRSAAGAPVAGAIVELIRPMGVGRGDLEAMAVPPAELGTAPGNPLRVDCVTTDPTGVCEVQGPPGVALALRVRHAKRRPLLEKVTLAAEAVIDVVLDFGAAPR
jgi:hypothetical protein